MSNMRLPSIGDLINQELLDTSGTINSESFLPPILEEAEQSYDSSLILPDSYFSIPSSKFLEQEKSQSQFEVLQGPPNSLLGDESLANPSESAKASSLEELSPLETQPLLPQADQPISAQVSPSSTDTGVYFVGDFESGDFSDWKVAEAYSSSIQVTQSPVRGGSYAAQFNLSIDDPIVQGSKRAEIIQGSVPMGSERWYGFSIFVPDDHEQDPTSDIVTQWPSYPDFDLGEDWRNPPLSLSIRDDRFVLNSHWDAASVTEYRQYDGSQSWDLGAVSKGEWIDWVFHMRWSYESDGVLEVWRDDQLVVDRNGPNTFNDETAPYLKMGVYKPAWENRPEDSTTTERTIYIDEVRIGNEQASFAAVDPGSYYSSDSNVNSNFNSNVDSDATPESPPPDNSDFSELPLDFMDQPVGSELSTSFSLEQIPAGGVELTITAFDIDAEDEAQMFLNEKEVELPGGIIQNNGGTLTDSVILDPSLLAENENTLTFRFASNLGGSTKGFEIQDLSLTQLDSAADVSSSESDFNNLPLDFMGKSVGTKLSTNFTVNDLQQVSDPVLKITAFDIDAEEEAKMYINEQLVGLPSGIIQKNGGSLTDSAMLDFDLLTQGTNTLTFEFASNLNGSTRGYEIEDLAISL